MPKERLGSKHGHECTADISLSSSDFGNFGIYTYIHMYIHMYTHWYTEVLRRVGM